MRSAVLVQQQGAWAIVCFFWSRFSTPEAASRSARAFRPCHLPATNPGPLLKSRRWSRRPRRSRRRTRRRRSGRRRRRRRRQSRQRVPKCRRGSTRRGRVKVLLLLPATLARMSRRSCPVPRPHRAPWTAATAQPRPPAAPPPRRRPRPPPPARPLLPPPTLAVEAASRRPRRRDRPTAWTATKVRRWMWAMAQMVTSAFPVVLEKVGH
mmetsp:Transcript_91153/g.294535  ORF Transcript_91153/g.294535 Transcript_91153/m.294535 type:complete len:209 (-) Transcript_91153:1155-1781(-)